jgi:ribonucleotide reductase alpha subunit
MIEGQMPKLTIFTQLRKNAIVAAIPLDNSIQVTRTPVQKHKCMN